MRNNIYQIGRKRKRQLILPLINNNNPVKTIANSLSNRSKDEKSFRDLREDMNMNQRNKDSHKISKESIRNIKKKVQVNRKQQFISHFSELESFNQEIQDANVTANFKKEIQKNLVALKRERLKMGRERTDQNGMRYISPKKQTKQSIESIRNLIESKDKRFNKVGVFSKLAEIINQKSSNSLIFLDDDSFPHSSAQLGLSLKKQNLQQFQTKLFRAIKTEVAEVKSGVALSQSRVNKKKIKNMHNYTQWRKLSITNQSYDEKLKNYHESSYELQTDRIEQYRAKNDESLKKYFEDKCYLSRLKAAKNLSLIKMKRK